MKIYNKEKNKILKESELNFESGYLKEDVKITHYDEKKEIKEEGHYETIAEYPNGGKDVKWIIDKPGIEHSDARDEKENILVYIPFTENEMKINKNNKIINESKFFLDSTDYIISKISEKRLLGLDVTNDLKKYNDILIKREEARKSKWQRSYWMG